MNTNGTNFQNGRFVDVDEVHNNTKNMTLSGFNQEGGKVTGNIQNLTIESKQNTSTTKGSTTGGSLSIAPNGMPSGSASYSQTNGERKVVDSPTTFIIGDGSNLKVGKVENTAGAIGATGSGKLSIDEYVGHNLENVDKLKTVGGSVGVSASGITSLGVNYSDRKQEGITKNTVIGNVEIGKSSGAEINKDLGSMTEITKDRDFKTDINIESQTINYIKNPEAFKQDLKKAKNEIEDIGNVIENTINPPGEDKRNFFKNLRAQRWTTSFYNVTGSRMEELSRQFKEAVRELAKGYGKDIGVDFEVVYLDEETMPKDSKGSTGSSYILDKKNKKVLIPIDVSKIGDINELLGTLTEEVSHGKDALEGRQDKKVAEDKSNDEEGLESLGRPANDYVKNKLGEDNNSKIKLSTDGIDLTNANVGEKVGDHLPMNDVKAVGGYEVVFKVDPSNDPLSIKARAWSEKYLTQERVDQIVNGVLNSATGTYIFIAGGTILVAVLTGGSGVIAIGPYLVSSGVAAVGGVAATTVGLARLKYGNDQLKNGLFDEKIVQPKHIIADSPLFRDNKEDYYLLESMIGIGAIQAAPHTFPIGTVENIPLQQGALPYYTNSPAVTNVGNTSLTLYNNQNGLFVPVGTNVIPAMTPLLITDGANKVNQVPALPNYLTKPEEGGIMVVGAGTKPKSGAYNTDINPKVGGVHFGDATNFKGIPDNFFSLVIIDNPTFNPVNTEILRVVKPGGEIRITGVISNSYFSQLYSKSRKTVKVPKGFELIENGEIPDNQMEQGYLNDGKTPIRKKTDRIIRLRKKIGE